MYPSRFSYEAPRSLAEAISLLHEGGDDAKVLAGDLQVVDQLRPCPYRRALTSLRRVLDELIQPRIPLAMAVRLNSHGSLPDMVLHELQDIVRSPATPNSGRGERRTARTAQQT